MWHFGERLMQRGGGGGLKNWRIDAGGDWKKRDLFYITRVYLPRDGHPFFSVFWTFRSFSFLKKNIPFFSILFFYLKINEVKSGKIKFFCTPWIKNERSVLSHSFQRNRKEERTKQNVLFKGTEKNGRNGMFFSKEWKRTNGTFFSKEWKRTDGTERSFQKNEKERMERYILFKRTEKNERNGTFLSKERVPSLYLL